MKDILSEYEQLSNEIDDIREDIRRIEEMKQIFVIELYRDNTFKVKTQTMYFDELFEAEQKIENFGLTNFKLLTYDLLEEEQVEHPTRQWLYEHDGDFEELYDEKYEDMMEDED